MRTPTACRRPDGQITSVPTSLPGLLVKPVAQKYSGCQNIRIILYCFPSHPTKGALRNVNNAGRDAVDADGAFDERRWTRTEKARGPGTPTLVSKFA